jgi:hypothetical protein
MKRDKDRTRERNERASARACQYIGAARPPLARIASPAQQQSASLETEHTETEKPWRAAPWSERIKTPGRGLSWSRCRRKRRFLLDRGCGRQHRRRRVLRVRHLGKHLPLHAAQTATQPRYRKNRESQRLHALQILGILYFRMQNGIFGTILQ